MVDGAECLVAGGDQGLKGRVTFFRILRHRSHDELASELAQAWHPVAWIGYRLGEMSAHDSAGARTAEGGVTCQQVVQSCADAVNIRPAIKGFATNLLGTHVQRCADGHAGLREPVILVVGFHQAEVDQLGDIGTREELIAQTMSNDQDIFRLDITMDQPGRGPHVAQALSDLTRQIQCVVFREDTMFFQQRHQAGAFDVFHRQPARAFSFTAGDDFGDVFVADLFQRPRFAMKPFDEILVVSQPRIHRLQRHLALAGLVDGQENRAHAAGTDFFGQLKFRQRQLGADQRVEIANLITRQQPIIEEKLRQQ